MSKPRIHILALGGTIATRPDASRRHADGAGRRRSRGGRARCWRRWPTSRPRPCRASAAIRCRSTRSMRSRPRSRRSKADGVVVTQGTDTLEETSFLLDLLLDRDIPVIVTAAMRNPALTSPDGPGNLLAAVRVACDPWVRAHARALGVHGGDAGRGLRRGRRAQGPSDAAQCLRLAADRSARGAGRGSRRAAGAAGARRDRRGAHASSASVGRQGRSRWRCCGWALDEPGHLIEAMLDGARSARLSRRRDRRDGRRPRARTRWPTSSCALPRRCRPSSRRAPVADRCCAQTYGGPSSEIALRKAGLIWGGRLHPLKARVLLETCLRAGLDRDDHRRGVRRLRLGVDYPARGDRHVRSLRRALLARLQFAFTVSFHFIFPAFSIGLASYLAVLEGAVAVTGRAVYLDLFKYWLKIFALAFGMGVVSGIVMSYQFGTNWSVFSDKAGPVIGPLMAYEVLTAFFLEAGFLGVMLFGMNRVGKGAAFRRHARGRGRHLHLRLLDPVGQQLDADAGRLRDQRRRPVRAGRLAGHHLQSVLSLPPGPHRARRPTSPRRWWSARSAPGTCCASAPTRARAPCSRWRWG